MSRVWKLFCWLLLVMTPAMSRGADAASSLKADMPSDRTVEMDKLMVSVAKFHWRYAKSAHFEILSSYEDDDFVARVVQCAEQIIKPFETNLTIYRSNSELTAKVIFIGNDGVQRFFLAIGTDDDVDPNKGFPSYYDPNTGRAVYPKSQQTLAFFRTGAVRPIWCHSAGNSEQFVIASTITKGYMDGRMPPQETKVVEYGLDLATTYLQECLREKKLNPESVLTVPFRHNGARVQVRIWDNNPYFTRWIAVNKTNVTIYRFYADDDIRQIKYFAADDLRIKSLLGDSLMDNPKLPKKALLVQQEIRQLLEFRRWASSLSERNYYDTQLRALRDKFEKLIPQTEGAPKAPPPVILEKPLLNLRDIVENTSLVEYPARLPVPGCTVDVAEKYFSFCRQATDFAYYCTFGPNPKTRAAFVNCAPSKTWCLMRGESPRWARFSQPPIPSVDVARN